MGNYSKIIDLISINRPKAKIVVESIYPINQELAADYFVRDITNDEIKNYNHALKSLVSEKKIQYIDLYSKLIQNNNLNQDYTNDGVSLNDNGYRVVQKEIMNVVG